MIQLDNLIIKIGVIHQQTWFIQDYCHSFEKFIDISFFLFINIIILLYLFKCSFFIFIFIEIYLLDINEDFINQPGGLSLTKLPNY